MTENLKEIKNQAPTQPKKVDQPLTTLKGYTTSQINQALKADNPYPARVFLKVEGYKEDIPVFFRIKEKQCKIIPCPECNYPKRGKWERQTNCQTNQVHHQSQEVWIKPKIKKGSYLEVKGHFDNPINGSSRKSFTAYSYQILEEDYLAQKAILDQAKSQLPEFEQALTNIQQVRQILESHDRGLYTFKK